MTQFVVKLDAHDAYGLPQLIDEGTRMSSKSMSHRAKDWMRRRWLAAALTSPVLAVLTCVPSHAQCIAFSERATQEDLDAFTKSPSSLLQRMRNDKDKLKYRLATYIATDPSVLPSVQTLIAEATSSDRSGIGAALRIAEARCISTKPDATRKIRDFVQRVGDLAVRAGYSAAGEDQSTSQADRRDGGQRPAGSAGIMSTKLVDPFKPIPLPR